MNSESFVFFADCNGELSVEGLNRLRRLEQELQESKYFGIVYALEIDDRLKIGSTTRPYTRYRALCRAYISWNGLCPGNLWISGRHTNYRETERALHKLLTEKCADGSEIFSVSLCEFIELYESADLKLSQNVENSDNPNRLIKMFEESWESRQKSAETCVDEFMDNLIRAAKREKASEIAEMLLDIADSYSGSMKLLLHSCATAVLTGEYVMPLPEIE